MGEDSADGELSALIAPLERELAQLQEDALFSGQYDPGDALVTIHGGEGGTDAQDWAEMLVRMYLRWAERRGFNAELLEASPGEEAGLKSAAMSGAGENAYGTLKAERGVHRLVRLSPFDSAHRRQTSFAQVIVAPLVSDDAEVEVDEADLRIDTYRASGAGGQHVNKTDSAVRITHLPTGIVVQCQNERSQSSNKQTALRLLRSRLAELAEEEREAELARERGQAQNTGFGSQIRSYVLHPYQLVKDLRTGHETGNTQAVLDGDLDAFIRAYLLAQATGGRRPSNAVSDAELPLAELSLELAEPPNRRGRPPAVLLTPVQEIGSHRPRLRLCPSSGSSVPARAASQPGRAMIVFDAVGKVYEPNVAALSDVSFVIEKGEFVFLVGPSGSGKSTVIKLLLKEVEPTRGRIIVSGRDLGVCAVRRCRCCAATWAVSSRTSSCCRAAPRPRTSPMRSASRGRAGTRSARRCRRCSRSWDSRRR